MLPSTRPCWTTSPRAPSTELITSDDSDDVVDVVLLWWREGDGDLVDALVDSLTNLGDSGVVWLLTPKAGRDGHVEPSDIDEAAPTAGLSSTRSTSAAPEWSGTRLVSPKASKGKSGAADAGAGPPAAVGAGPGRRRAGAAASTSRPGARLRAAEAVRAACGPDLGPLALEQALLRERARAKHPRGCRAVVDRPRAGAGLVVRRRRAPRPRASTGPVLDLCCSVGGDLLALPAGSTGVDLDEARLLLAQANAAVLGRDVAPGARRRDGPAAAGRRRRLRRPGAAGRRAARVRPPGVRAAARRWCCPGATGSARSGPRSPPASTTTLLPPDVEVEVVSLRGEVKEAVLWAGAARSGHAPHRDAPAGRRRPARRPGRGRRRSGPPGAGCSSPTAPSCGRTWSRRSLAQVGGWLLDETIAYVSADARVPTPYGRWFEVLEVMPFGLKPLRERLRAYDAGPLVVKKRGTAVEPDVLRKQLKLTGSTRGDGRADPGGGPADRDGRPPGPGAQRRSRPSARPTPPATPEMPLATPDSPPAADRRAAPPGRPGTSSSSGASRIHCGRCCTCSRRVSSICGRCARPDAVSSRSAAVPFTPTPSKLPGPTRAVVQPPWSLAKTQPPVGGLAGQLDVDVGPGGQVAGDVDERGQAPVEQVRVGLRRAAGPEVQGVHGQLEGARVHAG